MRGFPDLEYQNRLSRAQALMAQSGLDALLLTTEAEVRYFSGYLTRFWESPTRPWHLIVPQSGKPCAVIPSIGAALMGKTWIDDIRTWSSPDLSDDGVGLLAQTLIEQSGKTARIGVPSGAESHLRMPLDDWERLKKQIAPATLAGDDGIIRALRIIKSAAEIEKIKTACDIAGRAFARMDEIAAAGVPLSAVFRAFQRLCLEEGADWVPYLAGGSGRLGYEDVISPATDAPLCDGDVLMLDTGLMFDGYFCDYDRNYAIGAPHAETRAAWTKLLDATAAGQAAARPGKSAADIYAAMDSVLTGGRGGGGGSTGRLGHGLGMQLTEWPSLMAADETEIKTGMVLALEPAITMSDGSMLVHEDNFAISADGAVRLSPKAADELPRL